MKKLMIALLVAMPAGAQAMWRHGGMYGGEMHRFGPPPMGMHFATALYALLAALGYWVLQHAAKETELCVKRAGKTVAWFLIVIGLLGLLCGVVGHIRMHASCCGKCGADEAMVAPMAGGGGWNEAEPAEAGGPAQTIQVQVKTEKAPAKKK